MIHHELRIISLYRGNIKLDTVILYSKHSFGKKQINVQAGRYGPRIDSVNPLNSITISAIYFIRVALVVKL